VTQTVQIPPDPRILRALAEIDFDRWQCLAELIDNSFDEFLEIERSGEDPGEPLRAHVALPRKMDGKIVISDNGRGMTLDRITNAVRAGYSGNDPLSKLGLFGMGFNVSTARLGTVTTFLSTQAGDTEWVGIEIDINNIGQDFEVPVVTRPKQNLTEHGTRIEISQLNDLSRQFTDPSYRTRLRSILGGVYAYLLNERGYELVVDQTPVLPYRHCVWDAKRSVVRDGRTIKARVEIDEKLPPSKVCGECATWQNIDNDACQNCSSTKLEERERRIWGWLGIARELSTKEFGIDFLRNGRKILRFDRRLFEWTDPDDASGGGNVEYPLEVPYNRGRIVGEIHLDHVPVIYTKDGFDFADRSWKTAVRVIRGETSLLPRTAKARGDAENDSPLGLLHKGFRRNDPGVNYLTAGDGDSRLETSDWVAEFHAGAADYQDDHKWWEAAQNHDKLKDQIKLEKERKKREKEQSDRHERDDPTNEFFGDQPNDGQPAPVGSPTVTPAPAPPRPLTAAERVERWEQAGRPLPALKGEYTAKGVGARPIKLDAYAVTGEPVTVNGERVPVHLFSRPKDAFTAFVDLDHPLFDGFDDDPEDLVLVALAQTIVTRARSAVPLVAVYADLKERYMGQRAINAGSLQAEANQMLADLQARMVARVADDPTRPWHKALAEHERALTRERLADTKRTAEVEPFVKSGEYLELVPATAVPRIVGEWPEAFLDHRLFARPYKGLEPASQQQALGRITGYLNDVAWLAASPIGAERDDLIRARLSLRLLPDEVAAEASVEQAA
jgi:hypothetical protein